MHSFSRIWLVFLSSADAQFHLAKNRSTASQSGFLLPANAPAQSPASISDCRCKPHQRDDALFPVHIIPTERASVNFLLAWASLLSSALGACWQYRCDDTSCCIFTLFMKKCDASQIFIKACLLLVELSNVRCSYFAQLWGAYTGKEKPPPQYEAAANSVVLKMEYSPCRLMNLTTQA